MNNTEDKSSNQEERNLPKEVRDLLDSLPQKDRGKVTKLIFSQQMTAFRSPLPPPEILQEYKQLLPNSPDRFLTMVENEQKHAHATEDHALNSQIRQGWIGLIIGALLVILLFIGACYLTLKGHDTVAGIIFSTTIISIATIFVLRGHSNDIDNKE